MTAHAQPRRRDAYIAATECKNTTYGHEHAESGTRRPQGQGERRAKDKDEYDSNIPRDQATTALPVLARLEARVIRHELLQDRVQLVLGAHPQLQCIHERDEALIHY